MPENMTTASRSVGRGHQRSRLYLTPNCGGSKFAALLLVTAATLGCGDSGAVPQSQSQLRAGMKLLGLQYGGYVSRHQGAAPQSEAAFRSHLESGLSQLQHYGVQSVDDLLRDGRDGEPLSVILGATRPVADRPMYFWAAHEASASDGTRLACDSRGGVYELTEQEFAEQIGGQAPSLE